jgi:hypothetical protein
MPRSRASKGCESLDMSEDGSRRETVFEIVSEPDNKSYPAVSRLRVGIMLDCVGKNAI